MNRIRFFRFALVLALCSPAARAGEELSPLPDDTAARAPATPVSGQEMPALPDVLTLEKACELALSDSPDLQAAAERVAQARERVKQARALFFPFVVAGGSASQQWLSEDELERAREQALQGGLGQFYAQVQSSAAGAIYGGTPPNLGALGQSLGTGLLTGVTARSAIDDSIETYSASLTVTWILFNGFEREFGYALTRYSREEIESAYEETKRLLLSAVAASYYNAQLARENIDIAKADEDFNQRLLKEAEARRRVGTGSLSDELNFKVRVNAARSVLYQSQREYAVALIGLAELMGVPTAALTPDTQLSALEKEDEQDLLLPEANPLINYALANRPDLQAGEWAVKRTDAGVGVAKSAFYPEVTVSAGKDAIRTDDAKFQEDDFGTSVALNLSYTLFAGGRNKAAYAEAKSAKREAERNFDAAEITVTADVRQALENLRNAQQELQLQRENADLVQRNRDLVEKEYKAGVGSLVRLNEAQRDLVQAQARLATALVALRSAWFQVQTATAESLERFREESSPLTE